MPVAFSSSLQQNTSMSSSRDNFRNLGNQYLLLPIGSQRMILRWERTWVRVFMVYSIELRQLTIFSKVVIQLASTRTGAELGLLSISPLSFARLIQNFSGPLREISLVMTELFSFMEQEAFLMVFRGRALVADWVPPCALMPHPGIVGQPVVYVLAGSREMEPSLWEELHHAAPDVHEEHVCQLGPVRRRQHVRVGHYSHLC